MPMKHNMVKKLDVCSHLFMRECVTGLFFLLLLMFQPVVFAEEREEFGLLNFTAGRINVSRGDNSSAQYGMEYRFKTLFRPWDFGLRPSIGFTVANDHAKYFYSDLKHDFYMNDRWLITPSFGAGYFRHSSEIKLGSKLEFRSGVELAYEFKNHVRAGFAIFHLSNASTAKNNPGTEVAVFSLSIPMFND